MWTLKIAVLFLTFFSVHVVRENKEHVSYKLEQNIKKNLRI